MGQLVNVLPSLEGIEEHRFSQEMAGESGDDRVTGSALRVLRQLLEEKDPERVWGGLGRVLTPEGHYLWLCDTHAKEYRL